MVLVKESDMVDSQSVLKEAMALVERDAITSVLFCAVGFTILAFIFPFLLGVDSLIEWFLVAVSILAVVTSVATRVAKSLARKNQKKLKGAFEGMVCYEQNLLKVYQNILDRIDSKIAEVNSKVESAFVSYIGKPSSQEEQEVLNSVIANAQEEATRLLSIQRQNMSRLWEESVSRIEAMQSLLRAYE